MNKRDSKLILHLDIETHAQCYRLHVPYNEELIAAVRRIPGRRYVPEQNVWEIPRHPSSKTTEIYTHVSTKTVGMVGCFFDDMEL